MDKTMYGEPERIILGIDPGTNVMGFGVIRVVGSRVEMVEMGILDLRKEGDTYLKLKKIYDFVITLIEKFLPDEFAIEAQFFGKNVQSMLKLGRSQGVAIAAALQRDLPIAEYAPLKIKMSITGNGAASKEQVAMMIQKTLKVDLDPKYLDATDALAIALCHHYQMSNPLAGSGTKTDWKKFLTENPDRIKK
jgi:crossover junction endodeoxyribonuclease RuvC